ncbi:MAG: hypothetical protein HC804_11045 [Anaerolineae bacterium]|nr:hypothetical protein [Anaerolineae bacterium]
MGTVAADGRRRYCAHLFSHQPFAVLDLTCEVLTPAAKIGPVTVPALNWRSCYLQDIVTQGAMVRGSSDVTFARQYSDTRPYLYFAEMQIRWGMGLLLGLAAFAGLGWQIWRMGKTLIRTRQFPNYQLPITQLPITQLPITQLPITQLPITFTSELLLLAWVIPFFLVTGSFHVKFMRYLQPITPFLMLYAAAMLWSIRSRWLRGGVVTAVLLSTFLYALSFVNIYSQPHPWLAGSAWVYENVPPGALILSEQWDDALPSTMLLDGVPRLRSEYRNEELTWLTGADAADNEPKLEQNLARLAAGDYLTIMSNRVYGVAPRLDGRYSLSGQYHQLLFDGSLGYEPVYVSTRMPTLFGVRLYADRFGWPGLHPPDELNTLLTAQPTLNLGRADESFTVYDQPLLMIFENTGHLTAVEMQQLFTP